MNSESNSNSDRHRLVFNFVDKIDLNGSDKHIALSNIKQLLDKAMEDIKIYSVETKISNEGLPKLDITWRDWINSISVIALSSHCFMNPKK